MPLSRTTTTMQSDARDEIGAGGILAALWRQKLLALAIFLLCIGIGVLVIVFSPVRYTASTSILLDPRLGRTVGADPATPGFVVDSSAIDSQVKLLTSQTVLSRVATMTHLENDPEFSGPRFSIMRLLGLAPASPPGVDLKTLESAITIRKPERTYLVEILVSAGSPQIAAAIANAVADAYNEDQVSSRLVSARNDAKFVTQKREQLRRQIEQAERRLEDYKKANNIVSTDGLRSNEQQVSDVTRELGNSRGRLSELKARAEQVAAIARAGRLDSAADALKSPTIDRLRGSQVEAEREVAKLAETLGPRHPALMEAQAQAQRVRELIGAELVRLRQSAENDYQSEKRNEGQLVAELDRIKRQSTDTSVKLVPLRQLEREVDALRSSDDRFARVGDTLTQQEGDTPPARIIAAARPPVSPSWPRRSLILAIAAAVGACFGAGAALLRDGKQYRHRQVRTTRIAGDAPTRERDAYWNDEGDAVAQRTVVGRRSAIGIAPEGERGDERRAARTRRPLVWS